MKKGVIYENEMEVVDKLSGGSRFYLFRDRYGGRR
jgi:hypothetical protein